jgi:hypothetical protein
MFKRRFFLKWAWCFGKTLYRPQPWLDDIAFPMDLFPFDRLLVGTKGARPCYYESPHK